MARRYPEPHAVGLRSTWRRRSASTSAPRRRSSTPTSSRWPSATLASLADQIAARGIAAPLLLMLSNGGLTNIDEAKRTPVQLLESGPAAGALVAAHLGAARRRRARAGLRHGRHHGQAQRSSTTASRRSPTASRRRARSASSRAAACRCASRRLELIEIGAGGGSIAHLDDIGLLKVGPISAGSEPGPAAYGRGGTQPTVTDADLRARAISIPPISSAARWRIDMDAARGGHAPAGRARRASASPGSPGASTTSSTRTWPMPRACTSPSTARTRGATRCCATGGAGPVHAYYVAKKLGLRRLIAPPGAGVASALGLLIAPARVDRVATVAREMDQVVWPELEATFARLEADGQGRAGGHAAGSAPRRHRAARRHPLRRARPPSWSCRCPPAPTRPPRAAP